MARGNAFARGTTTFAATMMLVIGVFQFFQGLVAAVRGGFYVVTPDYLYSVNTTGWGWIHMALGAVLVLTGLFLFTGATWARVIGIGLVALSAIANFFFLPYYPLWSLLIIALDVVVIWALATSGRRAGIEGDMPYGYTPQHAGMQPAQEESRWPAANQQARSGYTEPAKTTPERAGDRMSGARDSAMSSADQARDRAGSTGDQMRDQARQAPDSAQQRLPGDQ